jgi:hypothetical protein
MAGTAAVLLALTACSTPAGGDDSEVDTPGVTDDTVTIGTHTPLTGPAAAGYSSISAAASAYFAYLNEQGGVHGRTIEYIVKDDGYNPATTQTVVRELVQEDDANAMRRPGVGVGRHQHRRTENPPRHRHRPHPPAEEAHVREAQLGGKCARLREPRRGRNFRRAARHPLNGDQAEHHARKNRGGAGGPRDQREHGPGRNRRRRS